MSKNDLKIAMDSLQVKKPLRLPANAPAFEAPIPRPESTSGPFRSAGEKVTQGLYPPQVPAADIPERMEIAANAAADIPGRNPTQGSSQSQGSKQTEGANPPPDHFRLGMLEGSEQIARSTQPRKATSQDDAVIAARVGQTGLARGYTRIPNSLLMHLIAGECSKHEIQIVLLVARMTISFRRELAPISRSVVERFTGIRGSGVLRAFGELESAGLIQRRTGNERRPSQLGLKLDPDWDWLKSDGTAADRAGNPGWISAPGSFQSRDAFAPKDEIGPVSPGEIRPTRNNTLNERNENSLSQLPEKLRRYFDEIRPQRKRESELQAYRELKTDFADQDIVDCLARVQERGIGGNGDKTHCHSPFAYLAKAMREVLAEVEANRAGARERSERAQREAEQARKTAEREAQDQREWEIKERAFARAFPPEERQREVIAELSHRLPFASKGMAARILSVGLWWDGLSVSERVELASPPGIDAKMTLS